MAMLSLDNNKSIGSISYNYLNLLLWLHVQERYYQYTYDAGVKILTDKGGMKPVKPQATTTYLNGIVYQKDTLQFIEMKKQNPLDAA